MICLNPLHQNYRIEKYKEADQIAEARKNLQRRWAELNRANFSNEGTRRALIASIDPVHLPRSANVVITTIRTLHDISNLDDRDLRRGDYIGGLWPPLVQELAMHYLATFADIGDLFRLKPQWQFNSGNLGASLVFHAKRQGHYRPNPDWLQMVHNFSGELLLEITRNICAQYTGSDEQQKKAVESSLVAISLVRGLTTSQQMLSIVSSTLPKMAERLAKDRRAYGGPNLIKAEILSRFPEIEDSERFDKLFYSSDPVTGVLAVRPDFDATISEKERRIWFFNNPARWWELYFLLTRGPKGAYAYHFPKREELLASIAEKGLSAQFAPADAERPDCICFNNTVHAGVHLVILGIEGYYMNKYLLRTLLQPPIFELGWRHMEEDWSDPTGDYSLARQHIIPPTDIEIVDPLIATRAIPLAV